MQFVWNNFEETDARGQITGYGIMWNEARFWAEWLVLKSAEGAFWLAFWVLLPGLGLSISHGASVLVPTIVITGALLGLAAALAWGGWRVPAHERWIVFRRDGTIHSSENGAWRTQVADIANIEWEELSKRKSDTDLPYTHGVRVVTKRRGIVKVAKNLEPEDAGTLAHVLSLTKERAKVAAAGRHRSAERHEIW
jgi:hypothetical protein